MITSRKILNLFEDWVKFDRSAWGKANIYKNPTSSDYLDMMKTAREQNRQLLELRFVADNRTETVYVCDGHNMLHDGIILALNLPPMDSEYLLSGLAEYVNGKAVFTELAMVSPKSNKSSIWKWVDKYIVGTSDKGFYN